MQNNLVSLTVGRRWPYPRAGEGLQVVLEAAPEGLQMMLVASLNRPTPKEVTDLKEGSLRLGLLGHSPLVWIILSAGRSLSLDAPYGLGLGGNDRAVSICRAAASAKIWPETFRQTLTLAAIDHADGMIRALRVVSLSGDWWRTLADLLEATPTNMTASQHRTAISASYAAYPSTNAMLKAAQIIETPGAV